METFWEKTINIFECSILKYTLCVNLSKINAFLMILWFKMITFWTLSFFIIGGRPFWIFKLHNEAFIKHTAIGIQKRILNYNYSVNLTTIWAVFVVLWLKMILFLDFVSSYCIHHRLATVPVPFDFQTWRKFNKGY